MREYFWPHTVHVIQLSISLSHPRPIYSIKVYIPDVFTAWKYVLPT